MIEFNECQISPSFVLVGAGLNSISDVRAILPDDIDNLRRLNIQGNLVTSFAGIQTLPKITTLIISGNKINGKSIAESSQHLSSVTNLRHLNLDANCIDSLIGLPCLGRLRTLQLAHNLLSSLEGLQSLAPTLYALDVRSNRLETPLSQHIRILSSFSKLKNLSLEGNPVCDEPNYKAITMVAGGIKLTKFDGEDVKEFDIFEISAAKFLLDNSMEKDDKKLARSFAAERVMPNLSTTALRLNEESSGYRKSAHFNSSDSDKDDIENYNLSNRFSKLTSAIRGMQLQTQPVQVRAPRRTPIESQHAGNPWVVPIQEVPRKVHENNKKLNVPTKRQGVSRVIDTATQTSFEAKTDIHAVNKDRKLLERKHELKATELERALKLSQCCSNTDRLVNENLTKKLAMLRLQIEAVKFSASRKMHVLQEKLIIEQESKKMSDFQYEELKKKNSSLEQSLIQAKEEAQSWKITVDAVRESNEQHAEQLKEEMKIRNSKMQDQMDLLSRELEEVQKSEAKLCQQSRIQLLERGEIFAVKIAELQRAIQNERDLKLFAEKEADLASKSKIETQQCIKDMESRISCLQRDIDESNKACKDIQATCAQKVNLLEDHLRAAESKAKTAVDAQLEEHRERLQLEDEISRLTNATRQAKLGQNEAEAKLTELQSAAIELSEVVQSQRVALQKLHSDHGTWLSERLQLKNQLTQALSDGRELAANLEEAKKALDLERQRTQTEANRANSFELSGKNGALFEGRAFESFRAALMVKDVTIQDLMRQVNNLKEQVEALKGVEADLLEQYNMVNEELEASKEECNEFKAKIESLSSTEDQLNTFLVGLKEHINASNVVINSEIEDHKSRIAVLEAEIRNSAVHLVQVKENLENEILMANRRIQISENTVAHFIQMNDQLNQRLMDFQTMYEAEKIVLRDHISRLRNDYEDRIAKAENETRVVLRKLESDRETHLRKVQALADALRE